MANHLKKSTKKDMTYEKVNEVTPPGFEPGAQIKMIQRVTTVPRSRVCVCVFLILFLFLVYIILSILSFRGHALGMLSVVLKIACV